MSRRRLPFLPPEVATAAAPQLPAARWRHAALRADPAVAPIGQTEVDKVPPALESVAAEVRPDAGRDHIGLRVPRPSAPMMMRRLLKTTLQLALGQPVRSPRDCPGPRPRCRCESGSQVFTPSESPSASLLVEIQLQPARLPRVPALAVQGRPVFLVDLASPRHVEAVVA